MTKCFLVDVTVRNSIVFVGFAVCCLVESAVKISHFIVYLSRTSCHYPGVVKASAGDFTSAIQLFSKVLELNPSHEAALKHITEARLQQMQQRERESSAAGNQSSSQAQSHRMNTSNSSHKRTS